MFYKPLIRINNFSALNTVAITEFTAVLHPICCKSLDGTLPYI